MYHFLNVEKVCQMANTHLLSICVCIVCPDAAIFGTGHLVGHGP